MDLEKIETMQLRQQIIKRIQVSIKLLVLVIFLGYILIWIMMPTNLFWLHWLPHIHAKTDSTYFGQEGANFVIYAFPILLIATLGCLYLHLEKYKVGRDHSHGHRTPHLASWRQPVLIKGALGIVSWAELSLILMFVALLVWSFSSYVHSMFNNITRQSASNIGELVWEVKLDSVALMLGLVGNICLSFLFFPVSRASPLLRLIGLTSESSIKYHIWLAHIVLTLFTAHALCYAIFWANTHQISQILKWNEDGVSNVAGGVALLSGIAMWITSSSVFRRNLFELFFYTHHLYIVFVVFFVLHVGFSYSCIMIPGFYLFLIDRFLRFLQSQQSVGLISARVLPCQAIELNFSKDPRLTYNPSSILFINVNSVSKLQWHPFTVTSNSNMDPDQLSVVIKSKGSWSQKLYEKLSSPTLIHHRLQVSVEGPYSPPSTSFLRHEMLVLVGGGSGITPFISIIRELVFIANTQGKAPRVLLVAAFKKSDDLTMLDLLLPFTQGISHLELQIEAYISRDTNPCQAHKQLTRCIYFKPSISDTQVSAVLGSSSWLWLGAIVSSSFIIFLLLIGLLNRYYIHPNHNMIDAARSTICVLLLCASVVIVATLAFVWNKDKITKEQRQIQSAKSPTPMASPMPEYAELESPPPYQSATKLHYGKRPNIKKILSECKGTSIGVFASGPKKMRQDVAAICCSSGSPKRSLHFESFSFNW